MEVNKIINKDCLTGLKELPGCCIDCCVTSPPYFRLRDYGHGDQIGLEATPEMYVAKMVDVFAEVKRVLKKEGTLWLNLGDSYCATGTGSGNQSSSTLQGGKKNQIEAGKRPNKKPTGDIKPKDLIGIPWMVAFALRSSGWYLRQDIIWHKPNPMPESVTDRCTKSHEYVFMLAKSSSYYYDAQAIKTPATTNEGRPPGVTRNREYEYNSKENNNPGSYLKPVKKDKQRGHSRRHAGFNNRWDNMSTSEQMSMGANKRSVWTVPTFPYADAHFATFPEHLITDMIKAGCPEGGIILDPFMGAGTTAVVARKLNRNFIGFELNPEYIEIANKRLQSELGMFL